MSRIKDLIQEMSPHGVTFEAIGDVAEVIAGATPSRAVPSYWVGGKIPWLTSSEVNKGTIYQAETFITQAGYDSCSTRMVRSGAVVMALAGQGKTRGMVARTRLECCTNQSLASIIPSTRLDSDFLYHFLKTQYSRLRSISSGDGTRGGLNLSMIRSFRVPVPPLEIQREIVKILDSFQALEAELEAELEARQRQYEHYRDSLVQSTGERAPKVKLRDLEADGVLTMGRGNVISKSDLAATPGDYPVYSSSGLGTGEFGRYGKFMFEDERITWSIDGGGRFFYRAPHKYSVTNVCGWMTVDNDRLRTKFLYYALTVAWKRQVFDYTRKAHPSVIRDAYLIGLPPLKEQDRIVAILDKFDTLVNDISVGLPAEIAARRKQYEYYRDRLFDFKEAAA